MFLASAKYDIHYASLFFTISGAYNGAPTVFAWNANNTAPHARRATSIAVMTIVGNLGGILSIWLLGVLSPAPRYLLATQVLLSFSVLMLAFSVLNTIFLWDQNRKKAKIRLTSSAMEEKPGLGDQSAWYIYHL